jgi:hypothetical protein
MRTRFQSSGTAEKGRACTDSCDRQQVTTLPVDEFIRRFLLHVLPRGFHRIRYYGLLAGSSRKPASLVPANSSTLSRRPPDEADDDRPTQAAQKLLAASRLH